MGRFICTSVYFSCKIVSRGLIKRHFYWYSGGGKLICDKAQKRRRSWQTAVELWACWRKRYELWCADAQLWECFALAKVCASARIYKKVILIGVAAAENWFRTRLSHRKTFSQKGACFGVVGFQNRDEFETFQKARSWAVLFVPPCFEASQNGSKARDFGSQWLLKFECI